MQTAERWTVRTIGVSSAKAVARTRTPRSDVSTAVTALNVIASAAGIVTGTVNATESTVESARETRSAIERDETAIGTATGNVIVGIVTVSAVTGTDETKRIVIERVGRTARRVVARYSPRKTAASLLVRDIALPHLLMIHSGNEEGSVKMTYVTIPVI